MLKKRGNRSINLVLIGDSSQAEDGSQKKKVKPDEIVRVYDLILQVGVFNIKLTADQNMNELAEIDLGEPEQIKENAAKALTCKALR